MPEAAVYTPNGLPLFNEDSYAISALAPSYAAYHTPPYCRGAACVPALTAAPKPGCGSDRANMGGCILKDACLALPPAYMLLP